jgi:autoinducer 2-degrading protein
MFTVIVNLTVRPEFLEEFIAGIHSNARASLRDEPGCLRFDVHQSTDKPHEFVLYEIYADAHAFYVAHRQAPHYAAWRTVANRCVQPGGHRNTFAEPAFPEDIPEAAHRPPQRRPSPL